MRIGFDAKRAFYNYSGLGNYSRSTILQLTNYYESNKYFLYTPSHKNAIRFIDTDRHSVVTPKNIFHKAFRSYWRTAGITGQLKRDRLDIFHGLSNEIPVGLGRSKIRSVVTIHDLIFLRYPELYNRVDRNIYIKKSTYSCNNADKIIAVSEQTKSDIIEFLGTDEKKIDVVCQSCSPAFYNRSDGSEKENIGKKYDLPSQYILSVGTIEERKNQLSIVKALKAGNIDIPVVFVGKKTDYYDSVKRYITENDLDKQISFYHNVDFEDLPAIYQMADLFVYPSIFEGFGIPIIEALYSGVPVITTRGGCFHEAAGPGSKYADPANIEEIAEAIKEILSDDDLKKTMISTGYDHVQKFNEANVVKEIMKVYKLLAIGC